MIALSQKPIRSNVPELDKLAPISQWVKIHFRGEIHCGVVIDKVAGTKRPKRVRIMRGALEGEVAQPHEYLLQGYIRPEEIDP